ncbi:hypothetical protein [Nostoc sp. FACHB-888]|uniref:hypothetical protein n=1 Tax=Nostoc sp. FACHB-888 TaxID=2692842 RepID=UPI00321FB6C5
MAITFPSDRIVKDVVDRIRQRIKIPNPYHIGEICILLPKDNPDLRGKAGYWGVVSHVKEYSCTLQTAIPAANRQRRNG